MMRHKNFAAMILTHGRPDRLHTLRSLKREGYTGKIIILIDDEDETADEYKRLHGEMVYKFNKSEIAKKFDEADNFKNRKSIVYARNVCFDIARDLGVKWFLQLDDDYTDFRYKADGDLEYVDKANISNLDAIFDVMLDFLEQSKAKSVAMAQGGDFIGGKNGLKAGRLYLWRKCMNTFFCDVDNPFQFVGRINEDVNTYVTEGRRGILFLTVPNVAINQKQTQANAGGMTDIYRDSGTYVKSFYSVMMSPSCVKVSEMGSKEKRLHHKVSWNNAVPLILREVWKK